MVGYGQRHIKTLTQDFSRNINMQRRQALNDLETRINTLKNNPDNNDNDNLAELEKEYEDIHSREVEGARIRSRIQWWEEGERSSKYFHNLERRNAKDKIWDKIMDDDGNFLYGTVKYTKKTGRFL